jgi:hypothetical protein
MGRTRRNPREAQVRQSRHLLSDAQLTALFRKMAEEAGHPVLAVTLINRPLNRGESLGKIFYTGESTRFHLSVKPRSRSQFEIEFGCVAGPMAGDGGTWIVELDDAGGVRSVQGTIQWVS